MNRLRLRVVLTPFFSLQVYGGASGTRTHVCTYDDRVAIDLVIVSLRSQLENATALGE